MQITSTPATHMISPGRLYTCHKHEVAEEQTDWEIKVDEIVNLAKELWPANRGSDSYNHDDSGKVYQTKIHARWFCDLNNNVENGPNYDYY